MTRRFRVHRRSDLAWGFGILGFVGVFLLLIGVASVITGHPVRGAVVGILGVLMLCFALFWAADFSRSVWTIEIATSGAITFVPARGEALRTHVADIVQIHIRCTKDSDGIEVATLEIHHRLWSPIRVDSFRQAKELVETLITLDPRITVTGEWPRRDFSRANTRRRG